MTFSLRESGYEYSDNGFWEKSGYSGIPYSDGDEIENRILHILSKSIDKSVLSVELTAHQTDWASTYHLSARRVNLIRPIAHLIRGDVLEIGAGCGAITRYIAELGANVLALEGSKKRASIIHKRVSNFDNVQVVADNFNNFDTNHKFDVITLIGVLEYAEIFSSEPRPAHAMLQRAAKYLKPNGKLIIAIENRLGLKYFSGYHEDHIGKPMYGIEDRYNGREARTYGKKELEDILMVSGFSFNKFYFPFPDYKLPKFILSESCPKIHLSNFEDIIINACENDLQSPMHSVFNLRFALPSILKNELISNLSNSFLTVSSVDDSSICASTKQVGWNFSDDRIPKFCAVTTFQLDDDDSMLVSKTRCATEHDRIARHENITNKLETDIKFSEGHTLFDEIITGCSMSPSPISYLQQKIASWLNFVIKLNNPRANHNEFQDVSLVGGQFFDAVFSNVIQISDTKLELIDKEWAYDEEVELRYLLFRSLSLLVENKTFQNFLIKHGIVCRYDFYEFVFTNLNWKISEEVIEDFIKENCAVLSKIQGRDVDYTENLNVLKREFSKNSLYDYISELETTIYEKKLAIDQNRQELDAYAGELASTKTTLDLKMQEVDAYADELASIKATLIWRIYTYFKKCSQR